MMLEQVERHAIIDLGVAVHEDVAKARRGSEVLRDLPGNQARLLQQPEQILIRLRLAQAVVGDDMRRRVQTGLNRELQRVLDEASLLEVASEVFGYGEPAQIGDAALDERELLLSDRGPSCRASSVAVLVEHALHVKVPIASVDLEANAPRRVSVEQ